ncbi:MAG: hypothetical protein IJ283_08755 [Oscillospiraceae bacterium]|nr:hypothetical protein [Oscillospiraceae bacterium]
MKKALALVLALVLALSMAVSAFAATLTELKPAVVPDATTKLKTLNTIALSDPTGKVANEFIAGEGGTYYVVLDFTKEYKDVVVTANGAVSAKLVEFDPEVYTSIGETYSVVRADGEAVEAALVAKYTGGAATGRTYTDAKTLCKYFNDDEKTTQYKVVCDQDIVLIELVIADNFSASYKEGTLKVEAKEKQGEKWVDVAGKWVIIRDVTIFEYEEVKYSAANDVALVAEAGKGYSDYKTALNGYGTKYDSEELRKAAKATVVSTTAFRAIEGKDLTVAADKNNYVTIYDVAKGQKGVNFELYGFDKMYDAAGNFLGWEFGFYGDQVVASDFVITLKPQITYYELRESFKLKVEEDDIVTYYLLKDGKVAQEITVDYMTVDLSKDIELELKGSNSTLGQYELVLAVDAAADVEENPNTGAESVVGVVAALAVVSVATAAAVSLKK